MTLAIPTVFATQADKTDPVANLDTNLSTIAAYINIRELTFGLLANRPAAGTASRGYFATDVNGGTLYGDNGVAWVQMTPGVSQTAYANQFTGLVLSNDAGTPNTVLDIAAGAASSNDATVANRVLMVLTAAFTKTTAAWVVGTGNGGLATGVAVANSTTYHVFLIQRTDTGVVDIAFDTSVTGANIAANTNANYTKLQSIGFFRTDGAAAIVPFFQYFDEFYLKTPVLDWDSGLNPGTATITVTLASLPIGKKVRALLNVFSDDSSSAHALYLSSLDVTDVAASLTAAPLGTVAAAGSSANYGGGPYGIWTNTSAQIRARHSASAANDRSRAATLGCVYPRGSG